MKCLCASLGCMCIVLSRFEWPDGKSFEGKYEGDQKHGQDERRETQRLFKHECGQGDPRDDATI
eukprot:407624-Amphidinium_carterae.1